MPRQRQLVEVTLYLGGLISNTPFDDLKICESIHKNRDSKQNYKNISCILHNALVLLNDAKEGDLLLGSHKGILNIVSCCAGGLCSLRLRTALCSQRPRCAGKRKSSEKIYRRETIVGDGRASANPPSPKASNLCRNTLECVWGGQGRCFGMIW